MQLPSDHRPVQYQDYIRRGSHWLQYQESLQSNQSAEVETEVHSVSGIYDAFDRNRDSREALFMDYYQN